MLFEVYKKFFSSFFDCNSLAKTLLFILIIYNTCYLFTYLQRLHPSVQKPTTQREKSLKESNSQSNSDNKKLQKQKSLWTTDIKNKEKNKIKAKVYIYILIFFLYIYWYIFSWLKLKLLTFIHHWYHWFSGEHINRTIYCEKMQPISLAENLYFIALIEGLSGKTNIKTLSKIICPARWSL